MKRNPMLATTGIRAWIFVIGIRIFSADRAHHERPLSGEYAGHFSTQFSVGQRLHELFFNE